MGIDLTLSVLRSRRLPILSPFGPRAAHFLSSLQCTEPARPIVQHYRLAGTAHSSDIRTPKSTVPTEGDMSHLRECWLEEVSDITGAVPL